MQVRQIDFAGSQSKFLATLLNLPTPHEGRQVTKVEEATAIVQFLLTGPGGGGRVVPGMREGPGHAP